MEIETVKSYIANSINLDGVRAEEIMKSLERTSRRSSGTPSSSATGSRSCTAWCPAARLQGGAELPPAARGQTDIVHVIKGVIEAEKGAIDHYNRIIEFCDGVDPVTQDMVITILHDEEGHLRLFEGFLREYEKEGLA